MEDIVIEKNYAVPIATVWNAITNKDEMKQWYFNFGDDFKLEVAATFEWTATSPDCVDWLHKGTMLEIVPLQKLAHSWFYPGYSGSSVVSWELSEIDAANTKLALTHKFIEPFDEKTEALHRKSFVEGWTYIINNSLAEHIAKNN